MDPTGRLTGFETPIGEMGRVMLVPVNIVTKMHHEFYKIVGVASKVILKEVGKSFGESVTEIVEREIKGDKRDMQSLLEAVVSYLNKSGFGDVTLEEEGDTFRVIIRDAPSISIEGCKYDNSIACYFEEGVVKGIMEKLLGRKVSTMKKVEGNNCIVFVRK